jgi:hypothetical protein
MKKALLALALTTFAVQASAQCALDLKLTDLGQGKRFELSFARVPNATSYIVEETVDGRNSINSFEISQDLTATRFKRNFERQSTYNNSATYRVTALGVPNCTQDRVVQYKLDPTFRKAMVRSVIPLVGSTAGANGSLFKTSLRLRAVVANQSGKLIFHPIGVPATSGDPFIRYNLPETRSVQEWDDVVAAFGATGLGTIDIVPDVNPQNPAVLQVVPYAEVRLFNVTDNGTFGTVEVQTQPFSFHEDNPESDAGLRVTMPAPELRLNVGVRTFLDSEVDVVVERNGQVIVNRTFDMIGDFLQFMPASAFVGSEVQPGDEIFVRVRGAGVPIYSLTDNKTNDPALFVPPVEIDSVVDKYQIVD